MYLDPDREKSSLQGIYAYQMLRLACMSIQSDPGSVNLNNPVQSDQVCFFDVP